MNSRDRFAGRTFRSALFCVPIMFEGDFNKENEMKRKVTIFSVFLLLVVLAFNFSGCSKLFGPSGPTDEDVIKTISASDYFKGGVGGITLQSPPVILEKSSRNKDGSWPFKVKVVFTVYMSQDKISPPMEQTRIFNMYKVKDSAGKTAWKAVMGQ